MKFLIPGSASTFSELKKPSAAALGCARLLTRPVYRTPDLCCDNRISAG